jgi:FtsH-binding integral membrane protein
MADNKPDVTKDWQASQGQKSQASSQRMYAWICWIIAIASEGVGIYLLLNHKFDNGNLPLLIGIFVGIAIFAILGSVFWKAAYKHDPASRANAASFFMQNQLGAIMTVIAFLPLLALVFLDKDMDPKNKQVATAVGGVLAVLAAIMGVNIKPPSVEQYTQDMNACAAQIKSGQPTTACSPEVASQAQDIARDSADIAAATKSAANPNGTDVVYWIAPEAGQTKSSEPHVFHLCQAVSRLEGKTVHSGTVTQAYAENAIRITKEIPMEQKQCGLGG